MPLSREGFQELMHNCYVLSPPPQQLAVFQVGQLCLG